MASQRPKSAFVPSLQKLCIVEYLGFLETSCYTYIQLTMLDSPLLRRLVTNFLPTLKLHLETQLPAPAGNIIRGEMLELLFSGKYPSSRTRKTYEEDLGNLPDDPGSHEDRSRHHEIREKGMGCCSLCCSAAFVVETMACVLVTDQIRHLVLDFSAEKRTWDRHRAIRKYVNFDIPSILSHLYASVKRNLSEERRPQLSKLVISGTSLHTRQFASSYDNTNFILNSYEETKSYIVYPTILSSSAVEGFSYQTNPYSEDLFLTLCDLFSFGLDSYEKLTELQLGPELSTRSIKIADRYGQPVSVKLFANIGISCPNLKILDVSNAISLPTESFIYLFFHDAYLCLHKYVYSAPWEVDTAHHCVVQVENPASEAILRHDPRKYCPYCFDPWACNGVRAGCEFLPQPMPVIDDRLYARIQEAHPRDAPRHLRNVVRATDLCRAVTDPLLELVRPPGPTPFEEGFQEEKYTDKKMQDGGWEYFWYDVEDPDSVEYQPFSGSDIMKLNKLCDSLQVLKLGHLGPRYEIVPFLLKVLPKVKTLGAINVLNGLKMLRDLGPEDLDLSTAGHQLEEITIDIVNRESGHNKLTASQWAAAEIKPDVDAFFDNLDRTATTVEAKRENLSEDIRLVASLCPNLRSVSLFIFSEDFPGLLGPGEGWVWAWLERLQQLDNMTVICHEWDEVSALFHTVGRQLGRLCLSLDSRGRVSAGSHAQSRARVPALDTLLAACPRLHTLKTDFRTTPLTLSPRAPDTLDLTRLTKLSAGLCLSKKAFVWLWRNAPNLEELLVPSISSGDVFDIPFNNDHNQQDRFSKDTLIDLFKSNPMQNLRKFNVHICLADISAASYLVESLRIHAADIAEIGKLMIRVQLPQNNYGSQEEILEDVAMLMQQMRRFKVFCETMADPMAGEARGTRVKWDWEKVGIFQSFAEIEQLNAMVEPVFVD